MKTIQPVTSWANGSAVEAKLINAYVISDNLATQATFYYALLEENDNLSVGAMVAQGNLTMTGADYLAYETNNYAWDWVASTLKLTITGDYVPPVPTTTTTTTEAPVETTTTTTTAP
jgi:hypothetical protein